MAPSPAEARSLVAEETPPWPRSPALRLQSLGRKGSSQFARSAAAPSSHLPLPSPSLLQPSPPSSPKPAASTDLSNGCALLGAGRRVAQRLKPGSHARERQRATPARLAPRRRPWARGEAVRKPSREGRGGAGGTSMPPGRHPCTWLALRPVAPAPPGPRVAFAPDSGGPDRGGSWPRKRFFLDAKGLIRVPLSREGSSGRGWCVRKANQSGSA